VTSPAFQWYPKDILASARVQEMSLAEEGAYRRLLDFCWINGNVPADPKRAARIIGKGCTEEIAGVALSMFEPCPEDLSRMIHDRLEQERLKQKHNSKERRKAAEARWKKPGKPANVRGKQATLATDAIALQTQSSSSATATTQQQQQPPRAREGPTSAEPPEHPAVQIFREVFGYDAPIYGQEEITSEVNGEYVIWLDVCKLWRGNRHDVEKFGNLIDRWKREVKKAEEARERSRANGAGDGGSSARGRGHDQAAHSRGATTGGRSRGEILESRDYEDFPDEEDGDGARHGH
jgi:uncharacterized protein YdaU (DUF1376 family)